MAVAERALRMQNDRRLGSLRDGSGKRCLSYVLAKGKIRFYPRHICFVHARCFGQPPFALCAFRRHQMASRGARPQHLATGSDLEAFRHCFARFAACNGLRHKAGKLIRAGAMTNALLWGVCVRRRNRLAGAGESNIVQFVGCNLLHGNCRR
jgi:hypothetical protein